MRIAYVCSDPGVPVFGSKGASIHAQAVLRTLVDDGHDVHLVTVRPGGRPMPGVTVHELPAVPNGDTAQRERAAQAADARVSDVLDQIAPDLVYERYSLWGRAASRWAAAHRVPSVLEVNAPLVEEQARYRELVDGARAQEVAREALSSATVVVCVSDGVGEWARGVSPRPERVRTIPNGVDVDRVHPTERRVTRPGEPEFTVGFVGTLKEWHGVEVLLQAASMLVAADRSWRFLLVGDGPMAGPLRAQAAASGISDQVRFTGSISHEAVVEQLHRMDIACAPYPPQDPFYFSPLKVYEYLAAGLPVVASAIGQIPGILDHGTLGSLVPPGDPRALADALAQLRADHRRREYLRTSARLTALERHAWTTVVPRILGLVDLEVSA